MTKIPALRVGNISVFFPNHIPFIISEIRRCLKMKTTDRLVTENINLVPFVVRKYFRVYSDMDDYCSIGNIGLIRAARTFDQNKKVKFSTYAVLCIHSEIAKHIRTSNREKRTNAAGFVHLDEMVQVGDEEVSLYEAIPSKYNEISDLENKILAEQMFSLIKTDREKKIISMYFGLHGFSPMNGTEIGEILGCTRQNVSLIIRNVLKYLRESLGVAV